MKEKIYINTNCFLSSIVKDVLAGFDFIDLKEVDLGQHYFRNNNVLLINPKKQKHKINNVFFLNNKVAILLPKSKKNEEYNQNIQSKILYGPFNLKYLSENLKLYFSSKDLFYKDIKIEDQNIININTDVKCFITDLEKKILVELVKQKKIKRDDVLETVFKINKNVDTKTIESHLTRIRKKLFTINSEVRIFLKDNVFYLGD